MVELTPMSKSQPITVIIGVRNKTDATITRIESLKEKRIEIGKEQR